MLWTWRSWRRNINSDCLYLLTWKNTDHCQSVVESWSPTQTQYWVHPQNCQVNTSTQKWSVWVPLLLSSSLSNEATNRENEQTRRREEKNESVWTRAAWSKVIMVDFCEKKAGQFKVGYVRWDVLADRYLENWLNNRKWF